MLTLSTIPEKEKEQLEEEGIRRKMDGQPKETNEKERNRYRLKKEEREGRRWTN